MEVIKEILSIIVNFAKNWGELFVAASALVVSIFAMIKASRAEKLQNKINELELEIKQYEVDKIKKEQDEENYSCVEARAITLGKSKHRMKVWNSGKKIVYNVKASFEGDPGILITDNEKQPFDELEPGKNYELVIIPHGQFDSKFKIITEWEDEKGIKFSKTQMGYL